MNYTGHLKSGNARKNIKKLLGFLMKMRHLRRSGRNALLNDAERLRTSKMPTIAVVTPHIMLSIFYRDCLHIRPLCRSPAAAAARNTAFNSPFVGNCWTLYLGSLSQNTSIALSAERISAENSLSLDISTALSVLPVTGMRRHALGIRRAAIVVSISLSASSAC